MKDKQYSLQIILQDLLLNFNFSKLELAQFIRSHSTRISAALNAPSHQVHIFFKAEQISRLVRMHKHIKGYEAHLAQYPIKLR